MLTIRAVPQPGFEGVYHCEAADVGYSAFIAIHSTTLGPATGGTRCLRYDNEAGALKDVLGLARAMTQKAALAGLPAGGGKAVLMLPARVASREALFRAHGEAVQQLGGRYVTAMDVGMTGADLAHVAAVTRHVAMHHGTGGAGGDDTARGVFMSMVGAARVRWGSGSLCGKTVAIEGCGNVGAALVARLVGAGATAFVADLESRRAEVLTTVGVTAVPVAEIAGVTADIFAPCAVGGTVTRGIVPRLRARVIVGGANNQLASPDVVSVLAAAGITYVPDYLANAGGMIGGVLDRNGATADEIRVGIDAIEMRTTSVLRRATQEHRLPVDVAMEIATRRLAGPIAPSHV